MSVCSMWLISRLLRTVCFAQAHAQPESALKNVLGADTRRYESAVDGSDTWLLSSESQGARNLLLSLEGKW